jgi:hypothetical protein
MVYREREIKPYKTTRNKSSVETIKIASSYQKANNSGSYGNTPPREI